MWENYKRRIRSKRFKWRRRKFKNRIRFNKVNVLSWRNRLYAGDLKSPDFTVMWVQIPPGVPNYLSFINNIDK